MREVMTSIGTAAGDLRAIAWYPDSNRTPLPGLVLVDGAGDGTADGWGERPAVFAGFGAVVLSHDKPGCGGSPGSWLDQSLQDRARETLAAVEFLRNQPEVDRDRVGLLGVSQGGWVSILAASLAPDAIRAVVTISGPGVSVSEQERYRIARAVAGDAEAMAWVDERARRLLAGEDPISILASQAAFADRPWYAEVSFAYDQVEFLRWGQGIVGFDPATVLPQVRCPVFAAFGGADPDVPAARSVANFARLLPPDPRHAFVVFPGANHGLYLAGQADAASLAAAGSLAGYRLPSSRR
jgi:uncharacterized protein